MIGNPPYGVSIKGTYRNVVTKNLGKVPDYEIYYHFVELSRQLLKMHGTKSYIIPNTFLFNVFAAKYRKQLLENWTLKMLVDCTAFKLFESATVHNAVTVFQKEDDSKNNIGYKQTLNAKSALELFQRVDSEMTQETLLSNNVNWGLAFKLPKSFLEIVFKIKNREVNLKNLFPDISQGLIAYDKYTGQAEDIIKNRSFSF